MSSTYIKSIRLKNFELHEDTVLNLSEGLNVIQGSSDQGKSSIIKASRLLCMNRPSGGSFVPKGAQSPTVVEMVIEDKNGTNHTIKRIRKGNKNEYMVDGERYKALGSSIPDNVKNILQIEDINIQGQFEQFFLLQDSPGSVAKKLNEFAGLSLIDSVMKIANSYVREAKSDEVLSENIIRDNKDKLEQYEHLGHVEPFIINMRKYSEKFSILTQQYNQLASLVGEVSELNLKLKNISKQVTDEESLLQKISDKATKIEKLDSKKFLLNDAIHKIEKILEEISSQNNIIDDGRIIEKLSNLSSKVDHYSDLLTEVKIKKDALEYTITHIKDTTLMINTHEEEESILAEKIKKSLYNFEKCPLCHQPLGGNRS